MPFQIQHPVSKVFINFSLETLHASTLKSNNFLLSYSLLWAPWELSHQ